MPTTKLKCSSIQLPDNDTTKRQDIGVDTVCSSDQRAVVRQLIKDLGIEPTPEQIAASEKILEEGLSCNSLRALHSSLWTGPVEFAGWYRQLETCAADGQPFLYFMEIQDAMDELFSAPLETPDQVIKFMLTAVVRIHPFLDMNRRVFFLAGDLSLMHRHFSPFNWGLQRDIWETARSMHHHSDLFGRQASLKTLMHSQ